MKKKIINVGIIGLGVGLYHYRAYINNKSVRVTSVCDFDSKKYSMINNSNIKYYKDYKKLILDKNVDLVSIASYDHDHYKQIILSLKNNKHVFVEKPICLNLKELEHINNLKKTKKLIYFSSNLNLRTEKLFQNIRKDIQSHKFGKIINIQASYLWGRASKIDKTWRNKKNNYSFILASGTHMIDLINWLVRDYPDVVYVASSKNSPKKFKFDLDDFINITFKYKNGLIVNIFLNALSAHPHFHSLGIFGTQKTFNRNINSNHIINKTKKGYKTIDRAHNSFNNKNLLIDNFIDKIQKKNKFDLISYKEIYYLMKICFACIESSKKSKEIKIKYK